MTLDQALQLADCSQCTDWPAVIAAIGTGIVGPIVGAWVMWLRVRHDVERGRSLRPAPDHEGAPTARRKRPRFPR